MKKLYSILSMRFIALSLMLICMIIVLMMCLLAVQVRDSVTDSLDSSISYGAQLMNQILSEAVNINTLVQGNSDVQDMLRNSYEETPHIYRQRLDINGYLTRLQHSYSVYADAFYLVLDDGRTFKSTNFPLLQDDFSNEEWYRQLRAGDEVRWLGPFRQAHVANNHKSDYMGVSFPLYNLRTGYSDGIVLIEIQQRTIENMLMRGLTMEHTSISIMDEGGDALMEIGGTARERHRMGDITRKVALENGWAIVFACEVWALILQRSWPFALVMLFMAICVVAGSIHTGRRTAAAISDPIEALLQEMNKAKNFRENRELNIHSDIREVDSLITNYNRMLRRIQELFLEVERQQREVKRSEFAALQAQINPHFLYNTLDNISWQIRTGHDQDALQTLMAFSQFFRISLSRGADIMPIRLELRHAELYLSIQKIRFGDDFEYSIRNYLQVADLENAYVPKLILQPLIENAISHGIQGRGGGSEIVITAERVDSDVVFTVWDNGCGIEPDKLRALNEMLADGRATETGSSSGSYGLYNINLRIKHIFGERYGLRLESELGEYTRAVATVPINRDPKLD